ncbi:MAG TPA: glycosyltransferase, partial [Thermoanaerobaculia bacterium]|nr:glycosyltransferase [Thermoanaerobaculia bacterium]
RDFFSSPLFRKKAVLVPRGVDTERFRPGLPRLLALREKLGVSPETVVIGCVAQLVAVKGHPTLLAALARVPGVQLWLAGKELDQEYGAALRQQIREAKLEDRVSFLGDVQDVPSLLAETDVFTLPTWDQWRMEGCPVALLEAMSSGLACVATDIPGSRDILEPERSGILVPPRDAPALALALERLARDSHQRRAMGEAARARVREHYAIETEVRAHEDLYDSILGGAAGARRAA